MASAMVIITGVFKILGPLPMVICFLCLAFMWLETAVGYCVGCDIYGFLLKKKWITSPKYKPVCPGGVCSIAKK